MISLNFGSLFGNDTLGAAMILTGRTVLHSTYSSKSEALAETQRKVLVAAREHTFCYLRGGTRAKENLLWDQPPLLGHHKAPFIM